MSLLVLVLLGVLTLLFGLGSYGLIDPDEGRYAGIPREMLARGDWITPTINGVKFFDKPALTYWSIMASYGALGVSEFAARLAMVVFGAIGVAATYALGRRAFGARAGWLGAAALLTTLIWPVMSRFVITDTPLAATTTVALCAWWLAHTEGAHAGRRTVWLALFWAILGAGVLAKGPVAVVLCFGAIVSYLLWCRPLGGWRMGWAWGVSLFFGVAAPWFIAVQARNPEFNHLFWWKQNFQRFTGGAGVPDHWEPPYYFLPLLPLVFFPWSVYAPRALTELTAILRRARSVEADERARAVAFLTFGALFTLAFFSLSKSKIVTYILPMVPLGCALLGAWFDRMWARGALKVEGFVMAVLALATGIGLLVARVPIGKALGVSGAPWLFVAAALAMGWAFCLASCAKRGQGRALFIVTAGGFAPLLMVALFFWGSVESAITLRNLLLPVRQSLTPDTRLVSVGFAQSVSFYTSRRVILAGGDGASTRLALPRELLPGYERMPPSEHATFFCTDRSQLARWGKESTPLFVIARGKGFEAPSWATARVPLQRLGGNTRYSLYGNRAAARHYYAALASPTTTVPLRANLFQPSRKPDSAVQVDLRTTK